MRPLAESAVKIDTNIYYVNNQLQNIVCPPTEKAQLKSRQSIYYVDNQPHKIDSW